MDVTLLPLSVPGLRRMRLFLQMIVLEQAKDTIHDEFAQMRLGEVCPIQTVEAVAAENARLVVRVVRVATVDEEALPFPVDELRSDHVEQLFDAVEVVATGSIVEVEVIDLEPAVITLIDNIAEHLAQASLVLLVLLTQQVEYVDVAIAGNKVVRVLVKSESILLLVVFELNFRRLLRLLGPKQRNGASDLDMREHALAMLQNEFSLNVIGDVAVLVDAAGVEPCSSTRCIPSRHEGNTHRFGEVGLFRV